MEPLELSFNVACSPEHAFAVWATIEPRAGGRIYERTRGGVEHDWGEVLAFEPPHRLAYLWHIVGDRSDATEVEITFTGAAGRTTVRIVHTGWERLGAAGPEMRRRNRQGWAGLLDHYQQAALDL